MSNRLRGVFHPPSSSLQPLLEIGWSTCATMNLEDVGSASTTQSPPLKVPPLRAWESTASSMPNNAKEGSDEEAMDPLRECVKDIVFVGGGL